MTPESPENDQKLRSGFTTGTCATAAAGAAARLLLLNEQVTFIKVALPRGGELSIPIAYCKALAEGADAGVIKDAGDDPQILYAPIGTRTDVDLVYRLPDNTPH
mgnify:CR=1 FL=1